jgi:hypothetical protein
MDRESSNSQDSAPQGSPSTQAGGRRTSFIASLIGRSISMSDDYYQVPENKSELDNNIPSSENKMSTLQSRTRSLSLGSDHLDGNSESSDESAFVHRRSQHSATAMPSTLFGINNKELPSAAESSNDVFMASEKSSEISTPRETSQTDHINKRLLTSFLTRINSMATNFIDPSGTGENVGQVYTDDVMMDRILRRVDSNPPDNQNN